MLMNIDKFHLNEIVFVKYNVNGGFQRGKIVKIKQQNCYDILYHNGNYIKYNVHMYFIRKIMNGTINTIPKLEYIKIDDIKIDNLIHIKYTDVMSKCHKTKSFDQIPSLIIRKAMFIDNNNRSVLMRLSCLICISYAYINKKKIIKCVSDRYKYKFRLFNDKTGTQQNLITKKKRNLEISYFDEKILDNFSTLNLDMFKQIQYNNLPDKYKNHISGLEYSNYLRIYKTEEVLQQNKILNIVKDVYSNKGYEPNMEIISHGCSYTAINNILNNKQGFQLTNPKNGSIYGNGIYFSSNINLSKLYSVSNLYNRYYVLICEAMIGKYKKTKSHFTAFENDVYRTGGNLEDNIYMKPWGYTQDINIAYVIEFNL